MQTFDSIQKRYEEHDYKFFDAKYAINLFGIRRDYNTVNEFDDVLGIAFRDSFGNGVVIFHEGTTKPGYYWLKTKKGNINGTAILQPGQYLNCWQFGKHNGKYHALRQKGMPFNVWRDGDSDGRLDPDGRSFKDVTGLNMHTTSFINDTEKVGAYSAGCQVRQNHQDHEAVMGILDRAQEIWKNDTFSYTLFENKNFLD